MALMIHRKIALYHKMSQSCASNRNPSEVPVTPPKADQSATPGMWRRITVAMQLVIAEHFGPQSGLRFVCMLAVSWE